VCDFIDFLCEFTVNTTEHTVASYEMKAAKKSLTTLEYFIFRKKKHPAWNFPQILTSFMQ
jgi:hypothetical protein